MDLIGVVATDDGLGQNEIANSKATVAIKDIVDIRS